MKIETAKAIVEWEDDEDAENFEEVREAEQVGKSRWEARYSTIYRDKRDETFWDIRFSSGLTEMQEDGPKNITVSQVCPKEKIIIVYQPIATA